jgi:hypothetical protein
MTFYLSTRDLSTLINAKGEWDGKLNEKKLFEISGVSNLDYAKDMQTRKSVSGYATFLNGSTITAKSKMQEYITLSFTEAELLTMTNCIQNINESIDFKIILQSESG